MRLKDIFKELELQYFKSGIEQLEYPLPNENSKVQFHKSVIFETNQENEIRKVLPKYNRDYFYYFLDGSRKVYRLGDMITSTDKYLPVIGAQISVGVCSRDLDGNMSKCRLERRNILCIYSEISEADLREIEELASENFEARGYGKVEVLKYSVDKFQEDMPQNSGIAKVHKAMQDLEIKMLTEVAKEEKTNITQRMMIIDGSLQFISQNFNPEIFSYVVGVSKSFNTSKNDLLRKKAQIGVLLSRLKYGERTPVFKIDLDKGKYYIGSWYLRIRPKSQCTHPLEGIIKVEKMALDGEIGLESAVVDEISAHLLGEVNPSCHGKDSRWANHLYPIYCTEKMVKSSFISDFCFESLL